MFLGSCAFLHSLKICWLSQLGFSCCGQQAGHMTASTAQYSPCSWVNRLHLMQRPNTISWLGTCYIHFGSNMKCYMVQERRILHKWHSPASMSSGQQCPAHGLSGSKEIGDDCMQLKRCECTHSATGTWNITQIYTHGMARLYYHKTLSVLQVRLCEGYEENAMLLLHNSIVIVS